MISFADAFSGGAKELLLSYFYHELYSLAGINHINYHYLLNTFRRIVSALALVRYSHRLQLLCLLICIFYSTLFLLQHQHVSTNAVNHFPITFPTARLHRSITIFNGKHDQYVPISGTTMESSH